MIENGMVFDSGLFFYLRIFRMVYGSGICCGERAEICKPWIFKWADLPNLWGRCCVGRDTFDTI